MHGDILPPETAASAQVASCAAQPRPPNRHALLDVILKLPTGRAQGNDGIPYDLFKAAGKGAIPSLWALLPRRALVGLGRARVEMRRLFDLWKGKKDPRVCSSSRGTGVGCAAASIHARAIRLSLVPRLLAFAPDTVCRWGPRGRLCLRLALHP